MKKRRVFYSAVLVALAGLIFTGFAYGYRHFYSPEERIAHVTNKITQELNLDDPQQQLLQEIATGFKKKMTELHAGREQAHGEVLALIGQDQITHEDIEALMAQHRQKFDTLADFAAAQFMRFHAALTTEQRGLLAQGIENHFLNARKCRFGR
jgi:uncharacterized membrane protein